MPILHTLGAELQQLELQQPLASIQLGPFGESTAWVSAQRHAAQWEVVAASCQTCTMQHCSPLTSGDTWVLQLCVSAPLSSVPAFAHERVCTPTTRSSS